MENLTPTRPLRPTINRISDLMAHSNRFAFHGTVRLARAAGVDVSTVSRILHGQINPSFALVARITEALEQEFQTNIDPRNVVAEAGKFLTDSACMVVNCGGCLPDASRDAFHRLTPEWHGVRAGTWVTSKFPQGFTKKGEA